MAITWKSVAGPDFGESGQALNAAISGFSNAGKGLDTFINQMRQREADQRERSTEQAIANILSSPDAHTQEGIRQLVGQQAAANPAAAAKLFDLMQGRTEHLSNLATAETGRGLTEAQTAGKLLENEWNPKRWQSEISLRGAQAGAARARAGALGAQSRRAEDRHAIDMAKERLGLSQAQNKYTADESNRLFALALQQEQHDAVQAQMDALDKSNPDLDPGARAAAWRGFNANYEANNKEQDAARLAHKLQITPKALAEGTLFGQEQNKARGAAYERELSNLAAEENLRNAEINAVASGTSILGANGMPEAPTENNTWKNTKQIQHDLLTDRGINKALHGYSDRKERNQAQSDMVEVSELMNKYMTKDKVKETLNNHINDNNGRINMEKLVQEIPALRQIKEQQERNRADTLRQLMGY